MAFKEVLILVLAKLVEYFFTLRISLAIDLGWLPLASYSLNLFNDRILLKDYKLLLCLIGLLIRLASSLTAVKS